MLLAAALTAWAGQLGFSTSVSPLLVDRYASRFGAEARGRLAGWQGFLKGRETESRLEREQTYLTVVNAYFNRARFLSDDEHWGVDDFWATPAEFVASNGGDCEDYAIAKYFALKELGVPITRMRLVYAKTWQSREAHMVLAYYPDPRADPLILDNLQGSIQSASDRPDLIPVYTFNDDDLLWPQAGAPTVRLAATSNRKWKDVLDKLQRELTY